MGRWILAPAVVLGLGVIAGSNSTILQGQNSGVLQAQEKGGDDYTGPYKVS